MQSKRTHVCLMQADAPANDGDFAVGSRWVCACGSNFVYREGFNLAGRRGMNWWEAPPVAIPAPRRARPSLRLRLIRPRRG